jgi:large subunit ribosomal protein L7/L12
MCQHGRLICCVFVLCALTVVPSHAAQLSLVAGTILAPEGANEGDTLQGGTVVKTGEDGLAMVEHRWRSDIPGRQCIQIAIFGYGQSYKVSSDETPGRCDTTVPTSPGDIRQGEAFLAKETRYGDAAFDEPQVPEKVQRSNAQWRGFDAWMRNAERTFTGDVVAAGAGRIRLRSPMSNREVSFAADASSVDSPVALGALAGKRVRLDYRLAPAGPRAIRIRLASPPVPPPGPLSPNVPPLGGGMIGIPRPPGTIEPPSGKAESSGLAAGARTDAWICTVDLHQGDTGTMEFTRRGEEIRGAMFITRGSQKHAVSGTWEGESIDFWRALSESSGQPFKGTVSKTGGGEVRMAGRFAREFHGVWSADCRARPGQGETLPSGRGGERYSVVLTGYGDQKVYVIKAVRSITGLGLKDSRDAVESAPYKVREGVSAEEAQRIAALLKEAGGSVRIEFQP